MSFRSVQIYPNPALPSVQGTDHSNAHGRGPIPAGRTLIMDDPAGGMLKSLLRLFLACALLHRLLGLLDRSGLPPGLDQLLGALRRDRLDRVAGPQAGVRLP